MSNNKEVSKSKSTAIRHILLIQHGQYSLERQADNQHVLSELGRSQAEMTGKHLASLGVSFDLLVRSTMTCAQETGEIIAKALPETLEVQNCSLLEECAPVPRVAHWQPEPKQFFKVNKRTEAAFLKYFHTSSSDQESNSFTLLVSHANVIRYLVCRALQFPPDHWLRKPLNHASITWISITPNGDAELKSFGDASYMDPKSVTHCNFIKKKREMDLHARLTNVKLRQIRTRKGKSAALQGMIV